MPSWSSGLVRPKQVGRAIAADFPNIDYVELAGEDFAPYSGDIDGLVHEIARCITGEAARAWRNRAKS